MDEGAIIDGVFHIAYGSTPGASVKSWVKNTRVEGCITSTVRVGGAQIDGLEIPDGIHILARDARYINQTNEGTPKGVHWHYGCKNINIGSIIVDEIYTLSGAAYTYALGIDSEIDEENPHDIYIKNISVGPNYSDTFSILIQTASNIKINSISSQGGSNLLYEISISNCENINIGNIYTKAAINTANHAIALITASKDVYIGSFIHNPDVSSALSTWGFWVNACQDVYVGNLKISYTTQGTRFTNADRIYINNYINNNNTQATAQSSSTFIIGNTFTVQ